MYWQTSVYPCVLNRIPGGSFSSRCASTFTAWWRCLLLALVRFGIDVGWGGPVYADADDDAVIGQGTASGYPRGMETKPLVFGGRNVPHHDGRHVDMPLHDDTLL
jgi:hypothetical protein